MASFCIVSFIFEVSAWYSKYINKGMGLEGVAVVLPVSTCGVLVRGLPWLLYEQLSSNSCSLCAPHNSAWVVQITPYSKSVTRRCSFLLVLLYLPLFSLCFRWWASKLLHLMERHMHSLKKYI